MFLVCKRLKWVFEKSPRCMENIKLVWKNEWHYDLKSVLSMFLETERKYVSMEINGYFRNVGEYYDGMKFQSSDRAFSWKRLFGLRAHSRNSRVPIYMVFEIYVNCSRMFSGTLKFLKLSDLKITSINFGSMLINLKRLETLELHRVDVVDMGALYKEENPTKLKHLIIKDCDLSTFDYLLEYKNLISIESEGIFNANILVNQQNLSELTLTLICPFHIEENFSGNSKVPLKKLSLDLFTWHSVFGVKDLFDSYPDLEEVTIRFFDVRATGVTCFLIKRILELKKLKLLNLAAPDKIWWLEIPKVVCASLRQLKLITSSSKFGSEELLDPSVLAFDLPSFQLIPTVMPNLVELKIHTVHKIEIHDILSLNKLQSLNKLTIRNDVSHMFLKFLLVPSLTSIVLMHHSKRHEMAPGQLSRNKLTQNEILDFFKRHRNISGFVANVQFISEKLVKFIAENIKLKIVATNRKTSIKFVQWAVKENCTFYYFRK